MRIYRTTRSCWLGAKVYGTYQLVVLSLSAFAAGTH